MWKLKNKLFGWDYILWENSVTRGIAKIIILKDGTVGYWRDRNINVFAKIHDPKEVRWLTCYSSKYFKDTVITRRSIHELLIIMLDNMTKFASTRLGLCILIVDLIDYKLYSPSEGALVEHYIKTHRPNPTTAWSWPIGDIKSRREWLIEQIKLTK